jgi:hypothetical protein
MYFLHPKAAWGLLTMSWWVIKRGIESEMTWGLLTMSWATFTYSNLSQNDLGREGD